MDYKVGKTGNINQKDGLKIYFFNDQEVIAEIKIYNFDYLEILQNEIYEFIPDKPVLNFSNSVVCLDLFVNENYRKNGFGKHILNLSIEETKKMGIEYWIGYRYKNNNLSKSILESLNAEIIENEKIVIFLKKV